MKKELLIPLNFLSFFNLKKYADNPLKFLLILVLSFLYTKSEAQTYTHPFSANGTLSLPAGMDQVTVEAWGAGGAGGAANVTLLVGRSGGGGGGGAYAKGTINTSAVQSLSVVVGQATPGGTGNGNTGGASYITGFTSAFIAPGGVGGNANVATTSVPNGGAGGGTVSGSPAIGNLSTINGITGGNGGSFAASLGLTSGGGGNAGNFGPGLGGAGAPSRPSLILANDAGLDGSQFGGGGSGARSSNDLQNGGGGARGQLNVTYTCKTYSLTGISATNVCTAVGITSTVQLTGTTATLPNGTYTVTYTRSNPLASGLTALMTVAGGVGTFTAAGLNTVGNSDITVNSLTSVDCTSTINTNNQTTVTVSAQPTITLGTTTPVCASTTAQNTSLTYSAVTNFPSTYSITWNASPTNSFVAVTNATLTAGSINIAIPANTLPGTYTGSLTVRNVACVSVVNNFTVTVNPLPTITLGTAAAVCFNSSAQSTNLTYSATTNSPTTYSIVWSGSPTNTFAAVTNATLNASPISIAIPAGTAAGTYTGTLTVRNANGCVSTGNNFTVTVNPLPTITLGTAGAVCLSGSAQTANLTYTATTNLPTTYSIVWNASPTNTFASVTNATLNASPISIAVPAGTAVGTYTGTLTVRNANGCTSSGNNFTVTVNPLPTITLGTTGAVCFSSSSQTANLSYSATTNTPTTYSIVWNASPTNSFTAVTNATLNASPISIAVPAGTAAGTYTGTLTVRNANGCISTGNNFTVTVNPLPTITLGTAAAVCFSSSAQTTNLSYSATTNSPTTYSIAWNASPTNSFAAVTNATLNASPITISIPANTAAATYTGNLTVRNANGCVSVSSPFNVTINAVSPTPAASVTLQPTCQDNTGTITVTSPASGTGYSYSIDGVNYSNSTGIFTGLASGSYNVKVRNNTSLCESASTPVTINPYVAKVWNGSVDESWGNAANWAPTGVPLANHCVVIPNVATKPVISGVDGLFFANRLQIDNNSSLIVESSNTLTVTNEVNVIGNGVFIFQNNASLVQISNAVNTGNITYRRDTKPVRRYDLTYWSSPVTRVPAYTLNNLSPGTLYDKYYKFDPVTRWITIVNGMEEMVKGNGYSIRAPQSYSIDVAQVFNGEFVGVPNNGTIQGPPAVAEGYNLLGNPYPSAIYADQFIVDNQANIYGTLQFWTSNSSPTIIPGTNTHTYNSNDYAYYNLSGSTTVGGMTGTGATTPGNQTAPAGYIAAGQGFFAKARTNQSVVFTNSMRVASKNSQFFKSTELIERHRVWLNLTNTEGAFKQLLIGYVTGATNLWDTSYDAVSMDANPYIDFYSINDGKKLVIQGRAIPFDVADTIPLGYRSALEGAFTISIDKTDGVLNTQNIYLEDKATNTVQNLKTAGYTFTTAIGVFRERFVLRYTNPQIVLGTDEFENTDKNVIVSVKDKNIRLQSAFDGQNIKETAVYDAGGHLLYQKKEINQKEWMITNFQSGPQVLFMKITLDSGRIVSRKIVFR